MLLSYVHVLLELATPKNFINDFQIPTANTMGKSITFGGTLLPIDPLKSSDSYLIRCSYLF